MGLVDCSFHVYPVKEKEGGKNLASLYLLAGFRKCYSLGGGKEKEKKKSFLCVCVVVFSSNVVLFSARLWNRNRLEFQIFLFGRASLEDNAIPLFFFFKRATIQ